MVVVICLVVDFYTPITNFFLEELSALPWFYFIVTFCYFMTMLQLIMTIRAGSTKNVDDVHFKKDATISMEIAHTLNIINFIYFFCFTTGSVSLVGSFITTIYFLLPFVCTILDLIMSDVIFFYTDFWIVSLMILLYVPFNNSG